MRHNIHLQLFSRTNSMRFTFVFLLAAQTVGKSSRFFPREVSKFSVWETYSQFCTLDVFADAMTYGNSFLLTLKAMQS